MLKQKRKRYRDQTLHEKMRNAILVFSLLPLILLGSMAVSLIYANQVGKLQEAEYEDLHNKAENMSHEMATIELMARTVWADTTFITEVGKAAISDSLGEYNRYLFQKQTLSALRVIRSVSQVQAARIHLDEPGIREYSSYLYHMDRARGSLWYEDRASLSYRGAWYMNAADGVEADRYSDYFTAGDMASFVLPVRISSSLTGVFEIMLPMKAIIPQLYDTTGPSDVLLVDSRNRVLGAQEGSLGQITEKELAGLMGLDSLEQYDAEGIQVYHGIWEASPVILTVNKDESNGLFLMQLTCVKKQYQTMAWQALCILVIGILMTVLLMKAVDGIVRRLLHDFEVFSSCMREVENGNLDVEIPRLDQVEINAVAVEYNRMLGRVKRLMEISIQREVMVKEAQLKSLEKQIDSHFLYNVLDSIKMMAEVRGIYNVADALLALTRMFRYNLQINSHSVTLQEEIEYLGNYLSLCNIRYDYYINFRENVEEAVKRLKVPKVILQPIAENSIVHGLDELAEDTTIYLKAYRKGECAYIEVTDMGKGMDENTLQQVREGIRKGDGGCTANGIGLRNIHERIRLMYGEGYGLEIYSKENCYTKIVLTIHAEEAL